MQNIKETVCITCPFHSRAKLIDKHYPNRTKSDQGDLV